MKRLLLLIALLSCGDAAAFKPGALGGHSGLGRKCGALGNCGGSTYGFPKSAFVIQSVGNSIARGATAGAAPAWRTQLATATTYTGMTVTYVDSSHDGFKTTDLTPLIAAEVDVNFDATKNNVLIFQEALNDIIGGATAAQAYAHIATYMTSLAAAGRWYKIVIMPTPIDSGHASQPTYETSRQSFIALVAADPTFGGTVNAVVRVDSDARIGAAGNVTDTYLYNADKIHPLYRAHAIITGLVLDALRSKDATKFAYVPQHMPYPAAAFSAAKAGSALASSGGAATNGQTVATFVADGAIVSGNATQATDANRPTYNSTGFGGQASLNSTAAKWMTGANVVPLGKGTIVVTMKATGGGAAVNLYSAVPTTDRRLYINETPSQTTYEFDASVGSLQAQPAGLMLTGAAHVVEFTFDGTFAGQHVYVDGTEITLTYIPPYNAGIGSTVNNHVLNLMGAGAAGGFVGQLGEAYVSPVVMSAHERSLLRVYLGTLRGITVAP